MLKSSTDQNHKLFSNIKIFLLIAITTWIAHFWNSESFGLYEDDYNRVSKVFDLSWTEIGDYILKFSNSQGRPLHDGFIYLFSFLGFKLGGIHAIYLIGYAIITVNTYVFYLLLRRFFKSQFFATTGALTFALFPSDTTKIFLTHSLGIQPSLTFLLVAIYCYLLNKKTLSYGFILGTLICYETIFPVFFAVPLISKKWDSKLIRELVRHILILVGMVVCVVIIRKLTIGKIGVIKDPDFFYVISWSLRNIVYGSITTISMLFYRPFQVLISLKENLYLLLLVGLCWAGLSWMFFKINLEDYHENNLSNRRVYSSRNHDSFQRLYQLTLVGFVLLIFAYPLTLTELATQISGRASRVHTAAVIGASIIVASVCSLIVLMVSRYRLKNIAIVIIAAFFALLIGFGFLVQQDYLRCWQYQQSFWADVIRLAPDLTDETVILVDAPLHRDGKEQIQPFDWSMPMVLEQIYQFPEDWKFKPRLYKLNPNWQQNIVSAGKFDLNNENGALFFYVFWEPKRLVDSSNVIFLEDKNGRLTRRDSPININNKKYTFKKNNISEVSNFKKKSLYDYLIKSSPQQPASYL